MAGVLAIAALIAARFALADEGYMLQMIMFAKAGMASSTGLRDYFRTRMDPDTRERAGPGARTTTFMGLMPESVSRIDS